MPPFNIVLFEPEIPQNTGTIGRLAEIAVIAPEKETYLIQEYHLAIYHLLCAMVEYELFDR